MVNLSLGYDTTLEVRSIDELKLLDIRAGNYIKVMSKTDEYQTVSALITQPLVYEITTLTDWRVKIANPIWTPDGVRDFYLANGNVAINIVEVNTIEDLKRFYSDEGAVVTTKSYTNSFFTGKAYGAGTYQILTLAQYTAITGSGSADGYVDHSTLQGKVAMLVRGNGILVTQAGALPSATTSYEVNIAAALAKNVKVSIPDGESYRINGSLVIRDNQHLHIGSNAGLRKYTGVGNTLPCVRLSGANAKLTSNDKSGSVLSDVVAVLTYTDGTAGQNSAVDCGVVNVGPETSTQVKTIKDWEISNVMIGGSEAYYTNYMSSAGINNQILSTEGITIVSSGSTSALSGSTGQGLISNVGYKNLGIGTHKNKGVTGVKNSSPSYFRVMANGEYEHSSSANTVSGSSFLECNGVVMLKGVNAKRLGYSEFIGDNSVNGPSGNTPKWYDFDANCTDNVISGSSTSSTASTDLGSNNTIISNGTVKTASVTTRNIVFGSQTTSPNVTGNYYTENLQGIVADTANPKWFPKSRSRREYARTVTHAGGTVSTPVAWVELPDGSCIELSLKVSVMRANPALTTDRFSGSLTLIVSRSGSTINFTQINQGGTAYTGTTATIVSSNFVRINVDIAATSGDIYVFTDALLNGATSGVKLVSVDGSAND